MADKFEKIKAITQKIRVNRDSFHKAVQQTKEDTSLSVEGKNKLLKEGFAAARKSHEALLNEYNNAVSEVETDLKRYAFSPTTLWMNRDTAARALADHNANLDRFSKASPKDLIAALGRAKILDDTNTARAIAQIAYERGFNDIVIDVIKQFPNEKEGLDNLWDWELLYGNHKDTTRQFEEKVELSGPQDPGNIKAPAYNEHDI